MADELTFYTNPMSRGRIARWMLEEVGRPYRTVLLDFGTGTETPEFRRINPMGKVPAIVHDGTVVTEAAAVCAYLADAFPEAGLAPEPRRRGAYYRWLFFAAGPVEAAVVNKALGVVVPPERKPMVGYGSLDEVLDALEGALSRGDHILGERFSAADVYVGSQLGWGMMFGTIDKRPTFERYFARLLARPAAQRARALDDALMPAPQPESAKS
jgi:glutathione S-transferase